MFELRIHTIPPLAFGGAALQVGATHTAINGEVPNMPLVVDNAHGQHTQQVAASDLLRARAELLQDGVSIYTGAVQSVVLGAAIEINLES